MKNELIVARRQPDRPRQRAAERLAALLGMLVSGAFLHRLTARLRRCVTARHARREHAGTMRCAVLENPVTTVLLESVVRRIFRGQETGTGPPRPTMNRTSREDGWAHPDHESRWPSC